MKKNKKEEDEEIRRAKANIRTGFIIAVIVIALLAVIAFVMVGLMSAITSLYYRVVVIRAPLQGLCYNVRDAVDWFSRPTARRFQKGSNHSPLQYC